MKKSRIAPVPESVEARAFKKDRERTWLVLSIKRAMNDLLARPKMTAPEHAAYAGYAREIAKLTGAYEPTQFEQVSRQTQAEARLALAEEFHENSALILESLRVKDAPEDDGGAASPVGDPSLN
jgi:hypothetical protein